MNAYRRDGRWGVNKAGRAGRKPLLSAAQRRQLAKLLLQGPRQLGYKTPLWTCPHVAHLVEREFGVRYHPGHVCKLLMALGWSPQRWAPSGRDRARERNRAEVEFWKKKGWPAVKKNPPGRACNRIGRREWTEPASAPSAHLGATRPDAGAAVLLQLEVALGGRRADGMVFLSTIPWREFHFRAVFLRLALALN